MSACPTQFADLLTPKGRRVLEGRVPEVTGILKTGQRFVALTGLLRADRSRVVLGLLERHLRPHLTVMEQAVPPEALWGQVRNYADLLPKSVRVRTATMASERSKAARAAKRCGLTRLLASDTFGQFARVLIGRPVHPKWGTQILCYGPGDYAGPHNDHHPEEPEGRDGYSDMHLTFCTDGVGQQLMVYEKNGHFTEQANLRTLGGVTAYRLPFWHFTTPLQARRGQAARARRWVLLGTFLDVR